MATVVTMPKLGFDMQEGQLVKWLKQPGDPVEKNDVIAEIESDKATVEVEVFEKSGTVLELLVEEGAFVPIDAPIAILGAPGEQYDKAALGIEAGGAAPTPAEMKVETALPAAAEPTEKDQAAGGLPGGVRASPLARRVAGEKGVDLKQVQGTGPQGRIVRKDVEAYEPAAEAAPKAALPAPGIAAPAYGPPPEGPDVEIIEVNKLRRRIGQLMVQSKQQFPHFYVTTEVDVEAMLELRKQLNAGLEQAGSSAKISVNDMIVKAAALTLRQFPNVNSHFYGDKIARHKRINVAVAVGLPEGGVMNVVAHDADKTALGTLAEQNKAMIQRALEGKVKPEDVEGGTFAVSNLGMFEVDAFAAIITPPMAGVLAVGSAKPAPVVREDGTLGAGHRMKVTISADHRVTDGVEAAEFLKAFKALVENPMRLVV
ncbi:MAG: 2-oxo acid dehydrogenase subunit E2 [Anaerolineae bacterium]|nr:2-oxo acid dehydrogenase subunit E2 [Anaerolineae bacterium]